MRRLTAVLACGLASLVLAPVAWPAPGMLIGAAEDAAKQTDPLAAKAKMDLARLAGFNAIRLTTFWAPGQVEPGQTELLQLQNAAAAANVDGIRIILSVYQWGSKTTPTTPLGRAEFAAFTASLAKQLPTVRDYIVGNEPNLNRFWMPQFGPKGEDVAARDYVRLLATTYDALKAVDPELNVIGGSVSPRGSDRPKVKRQTHSPTTFIPDMGAAYRAMHRAKPLMDSFSFHPYEDNSSVPPDFEHPRSTTVALADYTKLVKLLGKAFDGTPQKGSRLPVFYDEFGVQSRIPTDKDHAYTNLLVPSGRDAVPESVQGTYYADAIGIAYCQPTVKAFLLFHVSDEADLDRWQSGVFYADDTPKRSFGVVRRAALDARAGAVPECGAANAHRTGVTPVAPHATSRAGFASHAG